MESTDSSTNGAVLHPWLPRPFPASQIWGVSRCFRFRHATSVWSVATKGRLKQRLAVLGVRHPALYAAAERLAHRADTGELNGH